MGNSFVTPDPRMHSGVSGQGRIQRDLTPLERQPIPLSLTLRVAVGRFRVQSREEGDPGGGGRGGGEIRRIEKVDRSGGPDGSGKLDSLVPSSAFADS
jgi:hypothetical protein